MKGRTRAATHAAASGVLDADGVAELFAMVFELDRVDTDADFFSLGGDSLIAAALVNEIERRTGVSLSVSALINASTPHALASMVADARGSSIGRVLIPVRTTGEGPPIFSVHGMAGDDLYTHRLAEMLQDDRPIYTFRAIGLEAGEHPVSNIQAMADLYLAAIESVPCNGTRIIMGHCGAGVMAAWEIARRLEVAGTPAAGMILIEPLAHRDTPAFLYKSGVDLELSVAKSLKRAMQLAAWFEENPGVDPAKRREMVYSMMNAAAASYIPKSVGCPTLIVCREKSAPRIMSPRGYVSLLTDPELLLMDATHSDILDSRAMETVPTIRAFLNRVASIPTMGSQP